MTKFAHVTDEALRKILDKGSKKIEDFQIAVEKTAAAHEVDLADDSLPFAVVHARNWASGKARHALDANDLKACLKELRKYWLA